MTRPTRKEFKEEAVRNTNEGETEGIREGERPHNCAMLYEKKYCFMSGEPCWTNHKESCDEWRHYVRLQEAFIRRRQKEPGKDGR